MLEIERHQHQLHARLPAFQRKVDRAHAIIRQAFSCEGHPFYCAFSGGIDSTVLLHLLYQYPWQVPVRFSDDGYDFPETLQFLKDTEERYGFRLHRVRNLNSWRLWCEEMGRSDLADNPDRAWGNPGPWDSVRTSKMHEEWQEYGGVFLGLLASESRSRGYVLRDGWKPLYQVKSEHGMWHCSPLAHFTKQDIWSYVVSRELPYNPVYDKLAALGVPLAVRRVAPLTCFRTMQYGSVSTLKSGWPELFNHLAATFPKVREYV
jgi:phosphoadenosine phosphosulfate reductase